MNGTQGLIVEAGIGLVAAVGVSMIGARLLRRSDIGMKGFLRTYALLACGRFIVLAGLMFSVRNAEPRNQAARLLTYVFAVMGFSFWEARTFGRKSAA
ncbi:MAG: hypothetical protein WCU88_11285 [Elusimicrobiota bacterium]